MAVNGKNRRRKLPGKPPGPKAKGPLLNPRIDLSSLAEKDKKALAVAKHHIIYSQGDVADKVFYISSGSVKLSVISEKGKEGIVALLEEGAFFGEKCLLFGQSARAEFATAMEDSNVILIPKDALAAALRTDSTLSAFFVSHLIRRNSRTQADLVDQLFNSSEKRLARILLLMAHFDEGQEPLGVIPKISQETLAEMVGTTRSRISFFMNKFRTLGFIDYGDELRVHKSLLNVVLHD